MEADQILKQNQESWDASAQHFFGLEPLPKMFPLDDGKYITLFGDIKDKTLLELACGSGHSLKYILDNGAKKTYGIDFSEKQIQYATEVNNQYIKDGKLTLLNQAMEEQFDLADIDIVYSVYGFGWTQKPAEVLQNIYKSLKPGGLFIWSWDHPLCTMNKWEDGQLKPNKPLPDTNLFKLKMFSTDVYQQVLSIEEWRNLFDQSGFKTKEFIEIFPTEFPENYNDHNGYYAKEKIKRVPSSMILV